MFKDRKDAGKRLAERLARYRGKDAVVLTLPRGGVVVGYEVAKALRLPLDIVVARKVGHPADPEYAICAVDEKGTLLCDKEAIVVDQQWLKKEIERQRKEALRRVRTYRGERKPEAIAGKIAILVDDGIATGLTMRLAVAAVKAQHPSRIVVAVPVAPGSAVLEFRKEAEVVVGDGEAFRGSVGAHYEAFEQVGDSEVIRLLQTQSLATNTE